MNHAEIMKQAMWEAKENGYDEKEDLEFFNETTFYPIIFSHHFAKSFFGSEWRTCLIEMVVEKHPVHYIERHLKKNGVRNN